MMMANYNNSKKEDIVIGIVLAAGSGKRMDSSTKKQYMLLHDKPILYYSLKAFEESSIDKIVLVVTKDDSEYCKEEIIDKYSIKKMLTIVEGGSERYLSVFNGLKAITKADYVLIHDGARPFVSVDIIERSIKDVKEYKASIVGVPSKDTVKIIGDNNIVKETPDRNRVWNIQTPQCFEFQLINNAYDIIMSKIMNVENKVDNNMITYDSDEIMNHSVPNITDDAMILEYTMNYPIHITRGSYSNIKITTPEDLLMGQILLND